MRLNNKELKVVVDEIYKRVSQPTIDKNLKIEESILIKDSVTEDYEIFQSFQVQIDQLEKLQQEITNKYRNNTINSYSFGWSPFHKDGEINNYIRKQKSLDTRLAKYPTKEEIESQIIISGYSEIPELIERITSLYR